MDGPIRESEGEDQADMDLAEVSMGIWTSPGPVSGPGPGQGLQCVT